MSYGSTARRAAGSSLYASIGALPRLTAARADDCLAAEARFDPQSGPAAAASAERATSRLARAAASRGRPTPESLTVPRGGQSLDGAGHPPA
jgi:hypothetical protein